MKTLIRPLIPFAALALAACSSAEADPDRTVDGAEAARLVEEGATLLDVRTPAEYAQGHVDGALNVPVQELPGGASAIDRDHPVVVYCRSGGRSAQAARLLAGEGYEVHDLGPMSAWPSSR